MRRRISPPRLLPLTIVALAAVLVLKSVSLVRAAAPAAAAPPPATAAETAQPSQPPPTATSDVKPRTAGPGEEKTAESDSERALLQDLRQRRQELDQREARLAAREAMLDAAEHKLSGRVDELQSLQKQLEGLEAARRDHEEANWRSLVKLYESMKPRDAATIFNDLDMQVLLSVVDRMKEAKAAQILAAMQPEKARQVTTQLAERRTRATTPGTTSVSNGS